MNADLYKDNSEEKQGTMLVVNKWLQIAGIASGSENRHRNKKAAGDMFWLFDAGALPTYDQKLA